MISHPSSVVVGAIIASLTGVAPDPDVRAAATIRSVRAQQNAQPTAAPIVVVVLDDTKLIREDDARLAAAGVDAVHRRLLPRGVRVGAVTSGPGGLVVDATEDTAVLAPIAASLRSGTYTFRGVADERKASLALDVTIADTVGEAARLSRGPKLLVVIGRSARVSDERRATLTASRRSAQATRTRVIWLDLDACGCDPSQTQDAALLADPEACAVLSDEGAVDRVMADARSRLTR